MDKNIVKSKRTRIRGRLTLILVFLIFALICLCTRVGYLKKVYGEAYETTARTQQVSSYDSSIAPNRGAITDRNGQTLAVSTTVYNIVLDVRVLSQYSDKYPEEVEKTISALSENLEGVDYATLKGYVAIDPQTNKPTLDTSWKVLAKLQSRELKETLEALNLKGVVYEKDTKRKYTSGSMASHVVGFIRDNMWGVEKQYNEYMSGMPGRSFITYDGENGAIAQEIAPQDGDTVVTTLDYSIQSYAEETANKLMAEYNPENAGVIVMNPYTAEIYAMASTPTFDSNQASTPLALENEGFAAMWELMTEEEHTTYLNNTWKNFCISSTYEPGSIFKPIIVAAAMEEGVIDNNFTVYCGGNKNVAGEVINCHLRSGHGTLDVEGILAQSCNVGMMDIAAKMSAETITKYLKDFGFGSLTGIDLPDEVSAQYLIYKPENMGPVEIATTSFGQGFNATSLQCVNALAAAINGGNLMQPYVVSQVVDKDGNIVKENSPTIVRKVVSQQVSDLIKQDLIATVEVGTGKKAKLAGYTLGGKTGTAQQGVRSKNEYTVSYITYFPAENPQYIALVVMHKPETYADGVTTVAPATKELVEKIIKYKGIEPSYELEAGTVTKEKNVLVSDYTGENLFMVLSELEHLGLNYEIVGKGNTVVNQVPKADNEVLEGTKVTLYVEKGEDETGTVIVPDVRNKEYDEAVTILVDAGLEVILEGDELGVVTSMSPKPGVTVDESTEVKITLKEKEEVSEEVQQ